MQIGRRRRPARQDERVERPEPGIHPVDLAFEPRHLRRNNAQCPLPRRAPAVFRGAEVGAEIEQIVLDARQHCIRIGIRRRTHMQPRQPDRGIGLIDRAERLDPERLLWHARAVAERGLARVAAPCVDAGEAHHQRLLASIIKSAKSTSATACMMTRPCISLFESRGLPPRSIVATPTPRTPKTPSIASTSNTVRNVDIAPI